MILHALKTHYPLVMQLNALSPGSKAYQKAFAELRVQIQYAIVQDFRSAEAGDAAHPFKVRSRINLIAFTALMLLSVLMLILALIFGGDARVQEFTPAETRAFISWMAAIFAPMGFALYAAAAARRIQGDYLKRALGELRVDVKGITDEELSRILAGTYGDADLYDANEIAECGCYTCMARFGYSELRYDRGEAVCPACRKDTIFYGFKGAPLSDEILEKAKRFWVEPA